MTVVNGIRFHGLIGPAATHEEVERRAAGMTDDFESKDRLSRFAARALAGLTPAPDVAVRDRHSLINEEAREWGMP
jgi:hypothetical protein